MKVFLIERHIGEFSDFEETAYLTRKSCNLAVKGRFGRTIREYEGTRLACGKIKIFESSKLFTLNNKKTPTMYPEDIIWNGPGR